MRINSKQEQLIEEFQDDLKKHFPDVSFVEVTESWENPNDLWIHVTRPKDDDKEIALMDFFSEKTADILMDYGYYMLLMPSR
jgi:hypothetical protein